MFQQGSRKFILALVSSLTLASTTAWADSNYYEQALQAYYQKDIDAAFIYLKNALRENEQNIAAKILLGKVLLAKRNYALAEQELSDALALGADINLLITPLGRSYLHQAKYEQALNFVAKKTFSADGKMAADIIKAQAYQGLNQPEKAQALYQQVLERSPNHIDANLGLAAIELSLKKVNEAEQLLAKVESFAPDNATLWYLYGRLAVTKQQQDQAIAFYNKALALDAEHIMSLRALADLYVQTEQFQQANEVIDKLLKISPYDPQAKLLKSRVLQQLHQSELASQVLTDLSNQLSSYDDSYILSQPELILIDAMSHYAQQNWRQAENKFKQYISQVTDKKLEAVMLLADVYLKQDKTRDALALLSSYESQLLVNKDYALVLAGLYLQNNQNFKADYVLKQLRSRYPLDEQMAILSAQVALNNGEVTQALAILNQIKQANSSLFLQTKASVLLQAGDAKAAQQLITQLVQREPDVIAYQLLLAKSYLAMGEFAQAGKLIEQLYQQHTDDAEVKQHYALLLINQGKLKEALQLIKLLVEQQPNNGELQLLLADVTLDLGHFDDAASTLKALSKQPDFKQQALTRLAQMYFKSGQYEQSLSAVNELLSLSRLNTQALFMKAENLIALQQLKDATHQLNILKGLVDEDPEKLYRLAKLQQQVNDLEAAEYSLTLAHNYAPKALPVFVDMVRLKLKLKHYAAANQWLNTAKKAGYAEHPLVTILQGDIAFAQQQIEAAFKAYLEVFKQDNRNSIALVKLTQVTQNDERLSDQLISVLSEVVAQHPDWAFHRHTLADHLLAHQKYAEAKYQYQQLLTQELPPVKRAFALNNLATIHIRDHEYETAVSLAKQAVELLPKHADLKDTYGWALVLQGKANEGLMQLREAYSFSSVKPEIQYHIAYTLVKLNRTAEAIAMLTSLLAKTNHDYEEYPLAKALHQQLIQESDKE